MKVVNSRQEFLNSLDLTDKYCAEIGVFRGDFSKMILEKNPLYLYLIDPFRVNEEKYKSGLTTSYSDREDWQYVKKRFQYDKRVVVLRDYSYDAVKTIKDNYFDFIYLDGSHLLKDVKRDLKEWFPKLKKGGIMAGHDYIEDEDFGVIEAVNNFSNITGMKMFLFNQNGGDWALRNE
jgi:predicted rRNA methylase YqxC with S4 and FtsJ domains